MRTSIHSSSDMRQMHLELFDPPKTTSCLAHKSTECGHRITISFSEAAERFNQIRRQETYRAIAQMAAHIK